LIAKIKRSKELGLIYPMRNAIVFIDYASFLQKAWENIGLYIEILPTHWVPEKE
jgi:hypothetical protein